MKGSITFYHPEDKFVYFLDKHFCKVTFEESQHFLNIEIESTEDLDHVEEDSFQNDFPKVILTVEDFPLEKGESIEELVENTISIESSQEDDYTFLNIEKDDYICEKNSILIEKDNSGELILKWKGECEDFTEETSEKVSFEVLCPLVEQEIDDRFIED